MPEHDRQSGTTASPLSTALSEAESIISAAEKRAEEIVQRAENTYEELREKGYQDGLQKGHAEVAATAVRLMDDSTAISEKLSEEAAHLALAICTSILGEQVKVAPETVCQIALRALQEAVVGEAVTILVNPNDQKILKSVGDELRRVANGAAVSIESNETMIQGGCLVRTDFGEVDASIEALLSAIAERLGLQSNGQK